MMTSTTVRIRTSLGVKRLLLKGDLANLTVGCLKSQIISDGIFSEGKSFGLKVEGKRKNVSLDNLEETLQSIGTVDGTMFTIDFQGGIRAQAKREEEIVRPCEDLFSIVEVEKEPKRKRAKKNENTPTKVSNPAASSTGHFDVESNGDIGDLANYFLDNELGPECSKELGSFFFSQYTSAARMDALKAGKVIIRIDDQESASRSGSGKIYVTYRSIAGKSYEESCNFLSEGIISQLVILVLERTSTKRRRNVKATRSMFSVSSLATRAPWVLWPFVHLYGIEELTCQEGIDRFLDRTLIHES